MAFCKYCGTNKGRFHARDVCFDCFRSRRAAKPGEAPKRIFGANSIWDADRHFRERFGLLIKEAAREAKKREPLNDSPCHLWTMKLNKQGYGDWKWWDRTTGKMYGSGAHRISLELFLGRPLEEGMIAGHQCPKRNWPDGLHPDRRCFRGDHLGEITLSENMQEWADAMSEARRQAISDIYEITGIADIVDGSEEQ